MDEGARVWVADPADDRVWRPARVVAEHRPPAPAAVTVEYDEEEEDSDTESGGEETERGGADSGAKPARAVIPLAFKPASGSARAFPSTKAAADDAGECVNVLPRNAVGQQDQADLVSLPHLHEASILHALRLRYARHAIYTHIGEILISVNPFEKLPALYTRSHMERYSPDSAVDPEAGDDEMGAADPHLFGVARAAYVDVSRNARNQSILISGESGAGKTEATKIVMKYFALTCGQSSTPSSTASASAKPTASIETQVLQSNPILESFGNARTVRNDNSSRFGKFIELQFDPRGGLTLRGARIRTYLLEKIRVIQQARHERNFHIFYELLAALGKPVGASHRDVKDDDNADDEDVELVSSLLSTLCDKRREWGLRDAGQFRLLNQSECMKRRDGVEDGAQFRRTLRAMEQLGLTNAEISSVLEIVTAVLHMGNVEFAETVVKRKNSRNRSISESDRDSDIIHATTTVKVVRVNQVAREEDEDEDEEEDEYDDPMDHFAKAAALLGVEPEQLERALTRRWLHTANETLEVALDVGHAENTRNALAMECYRLLFEWLVGRINAKIHPDARRPKSRSLSRENSSDDASKTPEQELTIGLLDIFGFEDMAINSFEQLCINYANEALQHQFNEFVFASEQRLYREEGILLHDGDNSDPNAMSLDGMKFPDNSACLELFEKKPLGLFSLTDQECVFPQGTDRALVAKFYSAFAGGDQTGGSQSQQLLGRSRASSTTIGTHSHFVMASALQRSTHFGVAHYAGRVLYTAEGFLAKNKDAFCESAVLLLAQSRNPLIQALAISSTASTTAKTVAASASTHTGARRPAVRRANSSIAATSVGTQFKLQLNELLDIIRATTPHYVRCIKPNDSSSSGAFDTRRVVEQLRSGGVLEAVRVARAGFPVRLSHEQFLERYHRILMGCRIVVHHDHLHISDDVHACLARLMSILTKQQEQAGSTNSSSLASGVRLGQTRVFFRRKPFEALEKLRGSVRSSAATVIETGVRGFTARHRYRRLLRTVLVIQCLYRGHCARLLTHSVRANARATTLQRMTRGFNARRRYSALKTTAILCQSLVRMKSSKRFVQSLREHRAATRLAATWKRRFAQRSFRRMQSAVLALQCAFRSRIARRELLELKRESRNIAKLKEDNSALKNELAMLRAQLEAMQLHQQQLQPLGIYGVLPTPVLRPLETVMVASVLVPSVIVPATEKEQSTDAKNKRAEGAAVSDMEPQVDQELSQQEEEIYNDDEEDETSMSIPSFAYQTPGSDSCEESNNNQLQNDCGLVVGSRAASVIAPSACASRGIVGSESPEKPCAAKTEDEAEDDDEIVETGETEAPPAVEVEPAIEAFRPEETPSKALRANGGRPRRYSLPDIPSTFSITSTPCNTARATTKPTPGTDGPDDADLDDLDDLIISPQSRDRRRSLDLWLARQEHVEEELQQLREEVRATALAVASASTSAAATPTAEDQKEVLKKYVASQIKAKMVRMQLQPPLSPSLHLDMNLVDNNRNGSDDEDDGAVGDDEADKSKATRLSTRWRAPASVGYTLSRPVNTNARVGGGVTPRRRLDAINRVSTPITVRSRSDAMPHQPPTSSSCYAQRARNARTAWNFSGAASVAKPQSTKHSRGLQAYFADDDASDEEFDDFGNGTLRLRSRELQLPARSASVGLPPLRGGFDHCDTNGDEGRQPVIATAWTPVRQPLVAQSLVPRWTKDAACNECHCAFGLLVRRHHCRQCGHSFCYEHSTRKLRLPHFGYTDPQRVCDACFEAHLRGLSTCPSGSPSESSAWMRKRREASMAMARAAAARDEEDKASMAKMMGTPRITRRDTETSSVDSVAVSAM